MSCGGLKPLVYTVYEWECDDGHKFWRNVESGPRIRCNEDRCGRAASPSGLKQTYPFCYDRDAVVGLIYTTPDPDMAKTYTKDGISEQPKATYNQDPDKGGIKLDAGKPEWSMIPMEALEEVVHVFMKGRDKYTRNNWRKGMSWSRVMDSTMRHIYAWYWKKEDKDPESGFSHLAHAVANLMFLLTYEKSYKEGDDR